MRVVKIGLLVVAMLAMFVHTSQADLIIDTHTPWNKSESIQHFGSNDSSLQPFIETYGQTFTVAGTFSILDTFSFWLNDLPNPGSTTVDFRAHIMAWDNALTRATGSILWSSSQTSTTNNSGVGGFEKFTFNTGSLSLTSGSKYVAFLNTSLDWVLNDQAAMGMDSGDDYAGGEFVYIDNSDAADQTELLSQITGSAWTIPSSEYDAAFQAYFSEPEPSSTVPEPGSILAMLSLVGFGAGTVVLRRRKARQAAA